VFPSLEAHYSSNPDHLTDRVRRVMRAAGFFDADEAETEEEKVLVEELRTALVLTGARRPADLPPPVLTGFTLEWCRQRNLR
jgi:hypothetical protein